MEIAFQNSTYSRANIVRGTTSKDVNHDICTINDATKCMNNDILFDKCLDHFIVCVKKKRWKHVFGQRIDYGWSCDSYLGDVVNKAKQLALMSSPCLLTHDMPYNLLIFHASRASSLLFVHVVILED